MIIAKARNLTAENNYCKGVRNSHFRRYEAGGFYEDKARRAGEKKNKEVTERKKSPFGLVWGPISGSNFGEEAINLRIKKSVGSEEQIRSSRRKKQRTKTPKVVCRP